MEEKNIPLCTVRIDGRACEAREGERLSELLVRLGFTHDHPCGGRGTCRKCTVTINGRAELSCQHRISGGEEVFLRTPEAIYSETGARIASADADQPLRPSLVLDIGTTTLALALIDLDGADDGRIWRVITANNPQRIFGSDVMSRIAYARDGGVAPLASVLRREVDRMIVELLDAFAISHIDCLHVAGNTTMLHLFWGIDPTPMGVAPYTPAFLNERTAPSSECDLHRIGTVRSLPGFAAFVGADLVAGLHYVGLPAQGKYRLLVDLGTNAEILLFNEDHLLCTAAAAGPCFEGASISCGMSATEGAISTYESDGTYITIGDAPARGVCGTGLVDAIAALLENEIVDETGYMEPEAFYLTDGVALTREDIRQYQLAKSAVYAAIVTLMKQEGIAFSDIEHLYIAGGFAAKLRVETAVRTGLLPEELADRCTSIGNSSLLGTVQQTADRADLTAYTCNARYIDLSADPHFAEAFMEYMLFE